MTPQDYIKKNKDLQKYVGRKVSGCEILSIRVQTKGHYDIDIMVDDTEEVFEQSYSTKDFYRWLDFPETYFHLEGTGGELHGMTQILKHNGFIFNRDGIVVTIKEMEESVIKLLSRPKKEEVKNEEVKEGDVLICIQSYLGCFNIDLRYIVRGGTNGLYIQDDELTDFYLNDIDLTEYFKLKNK